MKYETTYYSLVVTNLLLVESLVITSVIYCTASAADMSEACRQERFTIDLSKW